jgi:hypothetical protein
MHPLAVVAAVVAVLAGPAAAGAQAPTRAETEPDLLRAVQPVLDARAAALRNGDREAWLATVDPAAPASFRAAQTRQFDGLRQLPLAEFSLQARVDDRGDLGPAVAARYRTRVFLPETRQVHRFAGYDDRQAVDRLWLTFVERGGRWYVGGDDDLEAVGLDTARGLWDLGRVATLDTDHFLVVHHPEQADRAAALAAIAEEAAAVLDARWDRPWSRRIPLVLPGSVEELEELLQSTIDLDNYVAFVSYEALRDDGFVATAPRIYVQDRNLSRYGRAFQVETIVHELVHAASVPLAGPFVPAWVHEGVADWVATGRPAGLRPPAGTDGRLPRDYEFVTGSRDAIVRSYAESRSATSFLADRHGSRAPADLFAAAGAPKVAAGSVDHHVDQAVRRVAGQPFAEFEPAWARR